MAILTPWLQAIMRHTKAAITGSTPPSSTDRSAIGYWLSADSFSNGTTISSGNTPIEWFNSPTVTNTFAFSGKSRSILLPIVTGLTNQGFQTFMDYVIPGSFPKKGDTIWNSMRARVAPGVDWDGGGGEHAIKYMRYRMGTSGSAHDTENSGSIYTKLNQDGSLKIQREGFPDNAYYDVSAAGTGWPVGGVDTTLEHVVVLDNVSVDSGGLGEQRFYRNGVLIFRDTSLPTLKNASDVVKTFAFISYWNNMPPAPFTIYVDDICIAYQVAGLRDDTPYLATDANGRKYIGL